MSRQCRVGLNSFLQIQPRIKKLKVFKYMLAATGQRHNMVNMHFQIKSIIRCNASKQFLLPIERRLI